MIKTPYLAAILLVLITVLGSSTGHSNEDLQPHQIQEEVVTQDIQNVQSVLTSELAQHEKMAQDAQSQIEKAKSVIERALAQHLSDLHAHTAELSEIQLTKVKAVVESIDKMKESSETLDRLEKSIKAGASGLSNKELQQATLIWREIVDFNITNLFEARELNVPDSPLPDEGLDLTGPDHSDLKANILEVQNEIQRQRNQLKVDIQRLQASEKKLRAGHLLQAGRIRSNLMNRLIQNDQFSAWSVAATDPVDYLREFKVVPYKFIATFTQKYFEFKSLSQEGVGGWVQIIKQLALLVLVLFIPLFIFKGFKRFSSYLDDTRKKIFTSSRLDYRNRTRIALWIGRINPYLPWAFAFVAIQLAQYLLKDTILGPVSLILPYINLYVIYRIFRIGLSSLLAKILLSKNLNAIRDRQTQLQATSKKLSVLLFTEIALLYATQDAVRKALIYNMLFDVILIINIIVAAVEARAWKTELLSLADAWIKASWLNRLENINNSALELIVYPIVFVVNSAYILSVWVYNWISQFEVGKKLSSEIFKKRLEEAAGDSLDNDNTIPSDYLKLYETETITRDTRVSLTRTPLKKCLDIINRWSLAECNDDLILLYGNYGIGKSTILNSLEEELGENITVKRARIEETQTRSAEFYKTLSELLGTEINSTKELVAADARLEKTVVVIDDIHKLYLNEPEGLAAYRSLVNVTSLQLDNIFWCFTCNGRALAHLKGIFGPNHLQGEHIELMSWSDVEIQNLILKRHRQSDMKLKFDQIISAVHRGDVLESSAGLEVQFFRMLWGQSRGNPKTAQELWLTATCLDGTGNIRVSVPDFTSAKELNEFSDESLLLFANIVKHETLSYAEMKRVSNLPANIIKQSIKTGEDGMIIKRLGEQKWRIHPKAQYIVHAQLHGRNLIYG